MPEETPFFLKPGRGSGESSLGLTNLNFIIWAFNLHADIEASMGLNVNFKAAAIAEGIEWNRTARCVQRMGPPRLDREISQTRCKYSIQRGLSNWMQSACN